MGQSHRDQLKWRVEKCARLDGWWSVWADGRYYKRTTLCERLGADPGGGGNGIEGAGQGPGSLPS